MRRRFLLALACACALAAWVAPAALAAAPMVSSGLSATEGVAIPSGTLLATFTSGVNFGLGCSPGSGFPTQLDWGDGTTTTVTPTAETVPTLNPCVYDVTGGHTYAEAGSKTLTVTVGNDGTPPANSGRGSVLVADAALTAGTPVTVSATVGTAFSGSVGTFTDGNRLASPSDFTATVSWGDGTSSSGTVGAGATAGSFTVSGTHTYAHEGADPTSVAVTDAGGSTTTLTGLAQVSGTLAAGSPQSLTLTAGSAYSGAVGTFTDSDTAAPVGNFSATINWGDGVSSAGTVIATGTAGTYEIDGAHTYAVAGSDTIVVAINDPYASSLTVSGSATVASASGIGSGGTGSGGSGSGGTGSGGSGSGGSGSGGTGSGGTGSGGTGSGSGTGGGGGSGATGATGTQGATGASGTTGTTGGRGTTGSGGQPGGSGTKGSQPKEFTMTIGHPRLSSDGVLSVVVSCPKSESTCRGYLVAEPSTGRRAKPLGTVLFILTGGRAATLDLRLSIAARRTLSHLHPARVRLTIYARDPNRGRIGSGSTVAPLGKS